MTRKEIIEELKEYENGLDLEYATPFDKAILHAIKELEQAPILEKDGTLIVTTEHYFNVGRVLVQYGIYGSLFYQDQEPEEERDSQEREIQAKEDLEEKVGSLIGYIDFLRNTAQGKRKSLNLMENLIKALFPDCEREIQPNKECVEAIRKYAVINRRRREDGKKM